MHPVQKMIEQFKDEVEGAMEYACCAEEYKSDPDLAKSYLEMAAQEIEHARKLHDHVKWRVDNAEVTPEDAQWMLRDIWNDKLREMKEDLAKAKVCVEMSK